MPPTGIFATSTETSPTSMPNTNSLPHENEWYNRDFEGYRITEQPLHHKRPVRLVCVGAGASGLQIAYKAERLLKDVEIQIYDKNNDIGGTWLENRYPGCTCDIPSHSYQFTWERNTKWSQFYSGAEEIWQYLKHVATKYNLEKYIRFNTTVESAKWDEEAGVWRIKLKAANGTIFDDACEILVNGSGVLNSWKWPDIPGINVFKGKIMHSATWDRSYDVSGKRVAVLGGGSSAVQVIPNIQPVVDKLIPFLRSPVWVTAGFAAKYAGPGGTNFNYSREQMKEFEVDPMAYDKYCRQLEGELSKRFPLIHRDSEDQKTARDLVANLMAEQLGHDPHLTQMMTPQFPVGCRRMTPGSGYLQSLVKPNVQVVTESAVRITEDGVVDESGNEYKVDVIICATGFDVSFTPHFEVIGRNGANLKEQFGDFPKAYLAVTAPNFPNLFLMIGPNGPTSHGSLFSILEWHTRYMFLMINKLQNENIKCFTPKPEAVHDLYNHTHELMKRLVWSSACRSWFKNGKTHGPVTAIYPGSRLHYFEMLRNVRYEDYEITYRSANRFQFMGNGYTECEMDPEADAVWYFDDPFVKV